MGNGRCLLTGNEGKFVDSHLIPRALTKHHTAGRPFIQTRGSRRPVRRQTSWYDPKLVTREGEDILSDYDNWAVAEFRKHRLIWDSWGLRKRLFVEDHQTIDGTDYGLRCIRGIEQARLRLFFLSLLWRAAASDLTEFEEVKIPSDELEQLRKTVREGTIGDLDFFPVSLTQLSTRGPKHNHAPIAQDKVIPAFGAAAGMKIEIFRFYFDGLIAHFVRNAPNGFTEQHMGPQAVGYSQDLIVPTVSYEASFQNENLRELMLEAEHMWPADMEKLYRAVGPNPE